MTAVFQCMSSDMHPYSCDGPGNCIHCDRKQTETHDPAVCALCSNNNPAAKETR